MLNSNICSTNYLECVEKELVSRIFNELDSQTKSAFLQSSKTCYEKAGGYNPIPKIWEHNAMVKLAFEKGAKIAIDKETVNFATGRLVHVAGLSLAMSNSVHPAIIPLSIASGVSAHVLIDQIAKSFFGCKANEVNSQIGDFLVSISVISAMAAIPYHYGALTSLYGAFCGFYGSRDKLSRQETISGAAVLGLATIALNAANTYVDPNGFVAYILESGSCFIAGSVNGCVLSAIFTSCNIDPFTKTLGNHLGSNPTVQKVAGYVRGTFCAAAESVSWSWNIGFPKLKKNIFG